MIENSKYYKLKNEGNIFKSNNIFCSIMILSSFLILFIIRKSENIKLYTLLLLPRF